MDRAKQIVSAALTLAVLTIPGASEWLHSVGGQAEVMTLTGGLWVIIHGTVEYIHGRATGGKT